jgi:hypothetical protein
MKARYYLEHENGSATAPTFWAAGDLAKAGYPVFPVKDKAPSVEGGFYAATTDASQLAEWITEGREHHDVAFATGIVRASWSLTRHTAKLRSGWKASTESRLYEPRAAVTGIFAIRATGRYASAPGRQMVSTARVTAVT